MKRFDGRAAHGIGRATAVRLAREGAMVTLADVDVDQSRLVAGEIAAAGGSAWAVDCDVRQTVSVDAAIAASVARFGRLDVLVTTAGGDAPEPRFEETDDAAWITGATLPVDGGVLTGPRGIPPAPPAPEEARR